MDTAEAAEEMFKDDIHLHIYQEDILKKVEIISVEALKGEQPYAVPFTYTGDIDFIAWGISDAGKRGDGIPTVIPGEKREEKRVRLWPLNSTGEAEYSPIGLLFIGKTEMTVQKGKKPSLVTLSLMPAVCMLSVVVRPAPGVTPDVTQEITIRIEGTQDEMDFDLNPCGKEITVLASSLFNKESQGWETGQIGLLPSANDRTVSIRVIRPGEDPLTIHTHHQAQPGDTIQLEIRGADGNPTENISLVINGWNITHFTIENA